MITTDFFEQLKKSSELLIFNDGTTLKRITMNNNSGLISLVLMPWLGLFIKEVPEYYQVKLTDSNLEKQIKDLRNIFKGKSYNKIIESCLYVDDNHNEFFKTFSNDYYNMGVYFDEHGHIISNTELLELYLNKVELGIYSKKVELIDKGKSFGQLIGGILKNNPLNSHDDIEGLPQYTIGFIDINTNTETELFINNNDKGFNLFLLHLLGILGTDKYLFQRYLDNDNTWRLRSEYITAHTIWSGLRIIHNHFAMIPSAIVDIDELSNIVEIGRRLFPSNYRNCMMHYNLIQNNEPYIKESYYRNDRVLFGLVESCFDGIECNDYYEKLRSYVDKVERFLNKWFSVDSTRINWD